MKRLLGKILLGVAAGVAVYVAFSVWADARNVGRALAGFRWSIALAALTLASLNYLVRFVRWHYYLRVLGLAVPPGHSFLVFLAGFSLTVTPGKLGEVVKAVLLRESHGIAAARTAPIVVAERFTDLMGLLLLACVGIFTFDTDPRFLVVGAALIAFGLVVVSVEPVATFFLRLSGRVPLVRRLTHKLDEAYRTTAALLRPRPLLLGVVLSVVSWFFECAAFWAVVHGFEGATVDLQAATFIYASMTVAGALSFLPGGLGVTEAGMLALLAELATGCSRSVSAAATFITRLCTLWFAVVVGLAALLLFTRQVNVRVDLPDKNSE
ncbi:MAG: flippase-like domain-containing protein [Deltaproteobacteria bacterium]|nr:flippase-like domain-containing protein [Deltaproteobacteria bacterium]